MCAYVCVCVREREREREKERANLVVQNLVLRVCCKMKTEKKMIIFALSLQFAEIQTYARQAGKCSTV